MPPIRKPPRPSPVTQRCRYVENGVRCRRVATVDGGFCRTCAAIISFDLDRRSPIAQTIGRIDRDLRREGRDNGFAGTFNHILDSLFGAWMPGREQASPSLPDDSPGPSPSSSGRPREPRSSPPPGAPSKPKTDPQIVARRILGFEVDEPLTVEKVKQRKQALARVFHPDVPTGSIEQMKRVNLAADLLLSKL